MKKAIKVIVSLLVMAVVFLCGLKGLRYIVTDDTASYTRIMMHEFYQQDENVDVLFMGASHCYRSFIPSVLDEKFGVNTFNLGSSSQQLDSTLLLLKEAVSKYDIKKVYVDLSYNQAIQTEYVHDNLQSTYLVTDYMKPSFRKYSFLLGASKADYYGNSFLIARRDWQQLFDAEYVAILMEKKNTKAYKEYEYDYVINDAEEYAGKGYVAAKKQIAHGGYVTTDTFEPIDTGKVTSDWREILLDMIDYCKEHNIEITLLSTPVTSFLCESYGNYDEYIEFVDNLIKDTGVRYIDFNLMKEDYWPDTSTNFKDDNHLNQYGAELFSDIFARYINGEIKDDQLFYGSMKEKSETMAAAVYGLRCVEDEKDDTLLRRCTIVSNRMGSMEYRITVTPDDEDGYLVQEFSENDEFTVPGDKKGICTVEYREKDEPENIQKVKIRYKALS